MLRGRKESKNITQIVVARAQTGAYVFPRQPEDRPMPAQAHTERRWTIYDIDGSNPREVTFAEFMARHRAAIANAQAIYAASVAKAV